MTEHLLVLDATNLAHRLFHGVRDRDPAEVFAFTIERYRKIYNPTHASACFDPPDKSRSWRRELWPAYKAGSAEKPEGLERLLLDARRACGWSKLALAEAPELEADDLIGAYTEASVARGIPVTILSGDKDMAQLVRDDPPVRLVREIPIWQSWGPVEVRERFGVEPDRIPDLFALIGDKSDGYLGVPKIGPKTAVKLLAEHGGTLEGLLERISLVRSTATMKRLREHEATARICYQLAQLRTGAPLPVGLDACRWKRP